MGLSAPGVGSNLDVNGLVSQLMAIERQPLTLVKQREAKVQSQISAYGMLQSQIALFGDSAASLGKAERLSAYKAAIADAEVASASAGVTASAGNYSLEVKQLAKVAKLATGALSSASSVVGTGSLTISLGTHESVGNTFVPRADKIPLTLTLDASNNTLAGVRDAINAAKSGFSATIVTDTSGARLIISSTDTGALNAIKIDAAAFTAAPGFGGFAFDPTVAGVQAVSLLQSAQDAKINLDTLEIVSASNQISGAIDGLTLSLTKAKPGIQTTLTVSQDNDSAKQALREFILSYNGLNTLVRGYTKYDAATKVKGALQGEGTAVSVLNQLRASVAGAIPATAGDFTTLSDIGITLQLDGSLKLDENKLATATATASGAAKMARLFIATTSNPDTYVTRMKSFVDKTQGSSGLIPSKTEGLSTTIKQLGREEENFNLRMVSVEARLRRQFNALDANLGAKNAVAAYLTNQTTLWNNANK
jgi:flagellar hook-associated protein 2